MTLSRLELGFESPWGRQNNTGDTVECRNLPRKPENQGFAVFCCSLDFVVSRRERFYEIHLRTLDERKKPSVRDFRACLRVYRKRLCRNRVQVRNKS